MMQIPIHMIFPNRFEHYRLYRAGGGVLLPTKKGKLEHKEKNRAHVFV